MEKLLHRIQHKSDQKAFQELFMLIAPQLLSFGYMYTKNKFIAEEIVDDIFLNLWKNRNRISEIKNIKTYLYTGVRNGIFNYFARDNHRKNLDLEQIADTQLQITIDPEQIFVTSEMRDTLETAINLLPSRCRMIFKMIKEDGLKHKEVAQILNLSQKTVENQLTIAIRKIRHEIQVQLSDQEAVKHNTRQ